MRLKTGFYLRLENLEGTLLRKALALLTNIRIDKDRHSSLLQTSVNYGCKHKTLGLGYQWKGINHIQSTRWQHLSRLKASAFISLQIFF
jgi:hypothetical protein